HFEDIPPETIPKRYYITEPRDVLNFLGSGLPALRRRGWLVDVKPRLLAIADSMPMIVPVVTVTDAPRGAFGRIIATVFARRESHAFPFSGHHHRRGFSF
ncbi:MAG: hypothetical protein IKU14_01790, partial [Rhodocyclaceae bacterium]|nr:hypothetical protein [Rhodocyclaceae bacterium]